MKPGKKIANLRNGVSPDFASEILCRYWTATLYKDPGWYWKFKINWKSCRIQKPQTEPDNCWGDTIWSCSGEASWILPDDSVNLLCRNGPKYPNQVLEFHALEMGLCTSCVGYSLGSCTSCDWLCFLNQTEY